MYNADKPTTEDLPSSAQLLKSTLIALGAAIVILFTVVLPAEYGIDPTGAGRVLGLTEMGEIKSQLAEEAEMDRQMSKELSENGDQSSLLDHFFGLFITPAFAEEFDAEDWRDELRLTLEPGESAEWKLVMTEGQTALYRMTVEGGRVNFDMHGHGADQSVTYEKARGSAGSEGGLIALFDGQHGWFWRNRDKEPVTVTLLVRGEYAELKEGE
ncbi:transmembrane anchor protein [Celeribacter litoreus]|uniref:transmembrane anchor protein n=1 Tax=Celeribacter litoreus TaxID=2876714 RepID=UPI001CCA6CB7|nr:transmembrane anchor protein [Celeribacter litoreus]MCA0043159.1 transmembrane anchor protein [Celeribacter litoreus]